MQQQQETIFYQDPSPIFISSTRAVFFDQTFVIRNINSISIKEVGAKDNTPIFLVIAGIILSCIGIATLLSTHLNSLYLATGILLILAGMAFFAWGIITQIKSKNHYALAINTAINEQNVIISPNHEYITTLQNALNQALVARGGIITTGTGIN